MPPGDMADRCSISLTILLTQVTHLVRVRVRVRARARVTAA